MPEHGSDPLDATKLKAPKHWTEKEESQTQQKSKDKGGEDGEIYFSEGKAHYLPPDCRLPPDRPLAPIFTNPEWIKKRDAFLQEIKDKIRNFRKEQKAQKLRKRQADTSSSEAEESIKPT
eukprot:gnl/TRDRNA2_/TRDRNA2_163673_c2_seq1.p2 gnl/TRDRNA2_/TRDRNA2_163673_c2~~gnl/TRDRNA2_/TRDRNA2_163673_c2_seq1.p2  ORF type:complete len:120 (+),score=24.82 gnl/TRDRNA2_/TRDRNA2_163673_c2_seq1:81-440(+)